MPSLSEAPSGGAQTFWLLLAGPAFRAFAKSDPPSGRNPKPPLPQQRIYTHPLYPRKVFYIQA